MINAPETVGRAQPPAKRRRQSQVPAAALLLAPFLLVYLLFFIYPTLRAVQLSFTNSGLTDAGRYVGGSNYAKLIADADFWDALWHTAYFALLTVIPLTVAGLVLALMVSRLRRARTLVQGLFFLPYVLPVSVVTLVWQWLLNPSFGVLNHGLGTSVAWFNDVNWAMPAVAIVTIWWTVGFNMLLFLAGLQNISQEVYEAAQIDGARGNQIFRFITLPLLWPITTLVLTLQLIASLKIFSQVYLLTGGGPFGTTRVVLEYLYETAFQNTDAGYASTIATAFFVLILAVSLLQSLLLASSRR